jgi:hypothetical protein
MTKKIIIYKQIKGTPKVYRRYEEGGGGFRLFIGCDTLGKDITFCYEESQIL